MTKKYRMKNLDCANCAAKMETAIRKIAGVKEASVSFMTQRLTIDAEDSKYDEIMEKVTAACRKIEPGCVIQM